MGIAAWITLSLVSHPISKYRANETIIGTQSEALYLTGYITKRSSFGERRGSSSPASSDMLDEEANESFTSVSGQFAASSLLSALLKSKSATSRWAAISALRDTGLVAIPFRCTESNDRASEGIVQG